METKLQDMIRKVEALLERSQNTTFPEEAASCQAKAQELMTKYQIEDSSLFGSGKTGIIISKKVEIQTPYIIDKAILLNNIAKPNFCKVLRGRNYAVIYGYESDIELVLTMYRMLLNDMIVRMMVELDEFRKNPIHELTSTISWKKSFFAGYAQTVGERLRKAKSEQISQVSKQTGSDKFALVVKTKESELEEYWKNVYRVPSSGRQLTSANGYNSGTSSGSRADIGQGRINHTRALNS